LATNNRTFSAGIVRHPKHQRRIASGLIVFVGTELKEFVNFHSNDKLQNETFNEHDAEDGLTQDERLSYDEVMIIKGALDLKNKSVGDVYTHLSQTFALNLADSIDAEKITLIKEAGKSRIPIYKDHKSNLVGFLLTKTMLFMDFSSPVRSDAPPFFRFSCSDRRMIELRRNQLLR
jgi:CBS domain containing-hemolysin-like protein